MDEIYRRTARAYDALYAHKDYPREATLVRDWIERRKRSSGNRLLDVGCGTGRHLAALRTHYVVEGLDAERAVLDLARARLPSARFHLGDMRSFALGRTYDAITCLFSAIGYVKTLSGLRQAVACMARHLRPGGVVVVEPFYTPGTYRPGTCRCLVADGPEGKVVRMLFNHRRGRVAILEFQFLIETPDGIEHVAERHECGLFTEDEYVAALAGGGLDVAVDPVGITGRGLLVAVKACGAE